MKSRLIVVAILVALACMVGPRAAEARRHRRHRGNPSAGCYVKIFASKDYKGFSRVLWGPANIAGLKLYDRDWRGSIDSIVTGPTAWVKVFKDPGFKGDVLLIPPHTAYPNLRKYKFGDSIDSIIILNRRFKGPR